MKRFERVLVTVLVFFMFALINSSAATARGYMGGTGQIVIAEPVVPTIEEEVNTDTEGDIGLPDSVEGPLNDMMSDQGKLFGDLYKILRYQGGVPLDTFVDKDFDGIIDDIDGDGRITAPEDYSTNFPIGGTPVLSEGYGAYAAEVSAPDDPETVTYELAYATYPSQCVQPVADYAKWGDISGVTGLSTNRLPLIMTYDATWKRTECAVGELRGEEVVDPVTGTFTTPLCSETVTDNCINNYFIPPGGMWSGITYCEGVQWVEMIDEVSFGRLNLSRSPEAVLQAAFDEAITAINNATAISRDAAGRLVLTSEIYEEFSTVIDETCQNGFIKSVTKAIDSPLENLALYVKLMKDGHLVTPGDERAPIDRSDSGGIPLWKMLELSDGPSQALRPTVNIEKLGSIFSNLVDVTAEDYHTYYECYTDTGVATDCLCEGVNPDGTPTTVACDGVASRKLLAVTDCPDPAINPNAATCGDVTWHGIRTDNTAVIASGSDFDFAAAFLSAAADKTGSIGPDMVVYINSIMGINKVIGYSAYTEDGSPAVGAIDYSVCPVYFDYTGLPKYDQYTVIGQRGSGGWVQVLQELSEGQWASTAVELLGGLVPFHTMGIKADGSPSNTPATDNILGFTQMADDDLRIIDFIHTYQLPGLR